MRLLASEFLGLSGHTWAVIGLVIAAATAIGGFFAAVGSVITALLNERKRTQPIVIAHDAGGRRFGTAGTPSTVLPTYLSSSGGGNAFNVRFGVDFDGVRYAWKFDESDSDAGSYQRLIPVGERLPEGTATFEIEIPWEKFAIGRDTDNRRAYWCRYENAYGKTWETRNPVDRSTGLDIGRVRFLRLHGWLEDRKRKRIAQTARAGLERDLAAMAAEAEAAEEAARAGEAQPPALAGSGSAQPAPDDENAG